MQYFTANKFVTAALQMILLGFGKAEIIMVSLTLKQVVVKRMVGYIHDLVILSGCKLG